MLAASASDSAASCPIVSMPSRFSFSSATGPIPHSRRTGNPPSSMVLPRAHHHPNAVGFGEARRRSWRSVSRTRADRGDQPVSSRTRRRRPSQNASTSCGRCPEELRRFAEPSSKESCSTTGTRLRTASNTRRLATPVDHTARGQHHRGQPDQPAGLMHRHGRPSAENPCLVAHPGHHAPAAQSANQHRPPAQESVE